MLISKYFKIEEEVDNQPPSTDSQEMIKKILTTFFPKNKQLNKKILTHTMTKLNGIFILNKPPGKAKYQKKFCSKDYHDIIPIDVNIVYDDLNFEEVILWDISKKGIKEILVFSYYYTQDLMKEKKKFEIDRKNLESKYPYKILKKLFLAISLALSKDILTQIEEYETLMKNYDVIMSFQMSSSTNMNNDHVIKINLNVNQDGISYNDTFEWGLENNVRK